MNRIAIALAFALCAVPLLHASVQQVPIQQGDGASQIMARSHCSLDNIATVVRSNHLKAANNYLIRMDLGQLVLPSPCPVHPSAAVVRKSKSILRQAKMAARTHHKHHRRHAAQHQTTPTPVQQQTTQTQQPAAPQTQPQIQYVTKYQPVSLWLTSALALLALLLAAMLVRQWLKSKARAHYAQNDGQEPTIPTETVTIGSKSWTVTATGAEVVNGKLVWYCSCPWGHQGHADEAPCHENHLRTYNLRTHLLNVHDAESRYHQVHDPNPMTASV